MEGTAPASNFPVGSSLCLSGQENLVTDELTGCQRVIADGYVAGQASDELLADLTER